jgi:hypothetical protein
MQKKHSIAYLESLLYQASMSITSKGKKSWEMGFEN